MRIVRALLMVVMLGVVGCHHGTTKPDDDPCSGLSAAQCEDRQAEANIGRTLFAEGFRGVPAEQLARDREAMEREWCITKAQRLTDHEKMVAALKQCRELWPERAGTTSQAGQ